MNKTIAIKQTEIYEYIDTLLEKLNQDSSYRQTVFDSINKEGKNKQRNSSKDKDYQIIAKLVEKEFKGEVISDTSVWRLLKIKESFPEIYKDVLNGKLSIKAAYSKAFPSKKDKQKPEPTEVKVKYEYDKDQEPNFDQILNMLTDLNTQLEAYKGKLSEDPSMTELKEIDSEVFALRKHIGWIITKMMTSDDYV